MLPNPGSCLPLESHPSRTPTLKLIQITDPHLSDRSDTPAAEALRWAIRESNRLRPDLVVFTGDLTTYGTAGAARRVVDAASELVVPWALTPGNSERRTEGAMDVLCPVITQDPLTLDGVRLLLPDTSTGKISESGRDWLVAHVQRDTPTAILTHYPVDTLDADSRSWVENWITENRIEFYLAGHKHFSRSRRLGDCLEVITRGLDPDKAFGGPPGISLFERGPDGTWSEQEIPWPHGRDLLPAETDHSPVGWSIQGDPVETIRLTRDLGLSVVELRPDEPVYDLDAAILELDRLRDDRPVYLSWHLPGLKWDADASSVTGVERVAAQVGHALSCGVDALTVHVPQVVAEPMVEGNAVWDVFLRRYQDLFREAVSGGVTLSIENIHNAPGTPLDREKQWFATEIGEFASWVDAVASLLSPARGRVGAQFDIGHARNNGELGNRQPLGDWYARIGGRITGYHIHQSRPNETTGRLTNHRDVTAIYDRTISFAGFLHAWSTRLINRAPLFVEVRDPDERRRTVGLFRALFDEAKPE